MNLALLLLNLFYFIHPAPNFQASVNWTTETNLSKKDVVYYLPGKDLAWADFKGFPQPDDKAAAITVSGFGYIANLNTKGINGNLDIKVYCYFDKNQSWVKPGKNTSYILKHEQLHFDISFIAASIFLNKLQKASFTSSNYELVLEKLYSESTQIMNEMQDAYDGETKNGQLKDLQFNWNNKIDDQVNNLIR